IQKLQWMNGVYIRQASLSRLADLAAERLHEAGILPASLDDATRARLEAVVALLQTRIHTLADFPVTAGYFFTDDIHYDEKAVAQFLQRDYVVDMFTRLEEALAPLDDGDLTEERLEPILKGFQEHYNLKLKDVIQPIRVALTGRTFSPG